MITADEIRAARANSPTIGLCDPTQRVQTLDGFVKRIYALRGFTVADDIQSEVDAVVKDFEAILPNKWSYLTMGEIFLALQGGSCGEYGQDKRLCLANFYDWIGKLSRSEERKDAIKGSEIKQRKDDMRRLAQHKLTPEESARYRKDGLRKSWQSYKDTGKLGVLLDGWAARQCDYLIEIGKLKPTEDTIRKAIASTRHSASALHGDLKEMLNKVLTQGLKGADWAAKRKLLEMYFEQLKARGVELTL